MCSQEAKEKANFQQREIFGFSPFSKTKKQHNEASTRFRNPTQPFQSTFTEGKRTEKAENDISCVSTISCILRALIFPFPRKRPVKVHSGNLHLQAISFPLKKKKYEEATKSRPVTTSPYNPWWRCWSVQKHARRSRVLINFHKISPSRGSFFPGGTAEARATRGWRAIFTRSPSPRKKVHFVTRHVARLDRTYARGGRSELLGEKLLWSQARFSTGRKTWKDRGDCGGKGRSIFERLLILRVGMTALD